MKTLKRIIKYQSNESNESNESNGSKKQLSKMDKTFQTGVNFKINKI
jgi:hypothetical protein